MAAFVLRRVVQSVFTIIGVMLLTFLLFRSMAGDIAAVYKGEKATQQQRAEWRQAYGYNRPKWLNLHRRLLIEDQTSGEGSFSAKDVEGGVAADRLELIAVPEYPRGVVGRYVFRLDRDTPVLDLTAGAGLVRKPAEAAPAGLATTAPATGGAATAPATAGAASAEIRFSLIDGRQLTLSLAGAKTAGELIDRINGDPDNRDPQTGGPLVVAGITKWSAGDVLNSQFFSHFVNSVTFSGRSLKDNQKLTSIIAERAPKSLALTVPAMALGWLLGMIVASVVAYYRDSLIDKLGVFLSVLGMCIPILAFMIYGQWLMFKIAPEHAYGLASRGNIYVPVAILVVAGLGGTVRFYRTVILDETNRDYVRTALAKGVPLPTVMFKHILKNCMLPLLTNLILSLPFLIMGSLLLETYFGIPGLGDLLITSITDRNEPILNGMVFLMALIYTVAILLTDLSYALFDPRIRLR